MKTDNFTRELPENYKMAVHIDARNNKTGLIFNLVAFGVALFVIGVAVLLAFLSVPESFWAGNDFESANTVQLAGSIGVMAGSLVFILYIVLHELTHGAAYKALTGEKLTFGLTLTVAFCGVPNIYVNRKTALISCAAPLVLFSVLLIPTGIVSLLYVALYQSVSALAVFVATTFVFAFHLGGCAGDAYLILLLLSKYKDKATLIRDTGPEQFIYVPEK